MKYSQHLNDIHKDFLFRTELRGPADCQLPKLKTALHHKEKDIIHYRRLRQGLANGMILKDVHRDLQLKQGACLKPYIDPNTKAFEKTIASSVFIQYLYCISGSKFR